MKKNLFKSKKRESINSSDINECTDIAIIGMACRLPDASNYEEFWENLKMGRSSVRETPKERWDWKDYCEISELSKDISKWGTYINDVDTFDARFFEFSNREVEIMDPQQRIMLELSWSCFEDAAICPSSVSGKEIGVFCGAFNCDYKELLDYNQKSIDAYTLLGTTSSLIPNRISYYFNLNGPSYEINSACSGTQLAIHNACDSILNGECEMALAGGISLSLSPTRQAAITQLGILSKTGSCKTFDKNADGYVRGEGAGILLLKKLSEAMRDGDPIHGVIKGSAINHGGKMHTLTYPNANAQADLIKKAIKAANISPQTISYIEAHGTGTRKGDPIEIDGLKKAFSNFDMNDSSQEQRKNYCGIGAVKTNVGHLEPASSIPSVIKVLLSMKYRQLPGLLHFNELNPEISVKDTPFYFVKELTNWDNLRIDGNEIPLRAGISSFGVGGANGHIIIEEPPKKEKSCTYENEFYLICISAKTSESLRNRVMDLKDWLDVSGQKCNLNDISFTLMIGREHFSERIAFVANNISDLKKRIVEVLENNESDKNKPVNSFTQQEIDKLLYQVKECRNRTDSEYRDKLTKLAQLYTDGHEFDWKKVFPLLGRRINLPTYPFMKEHFPLPKSKGMLIRDKEKDLNLHPLLQHNVSTFSKQCYCSSFTGDEYFLKAYMKNGIQSLPRVICLEMARAALDDAVKDSVDGSYSIELEDIVWNMEPSHDKNFLQFEISLSPVDDGKIAFQIYNQKKVRGQEKTACCNGIGMIVQSDNNKKLDLDIETIKNRINPAYYTLEEYGQLLNITNRCYEDTFMCMTELYVGQASVLAKVELPDHISNTLDSFILHPTMINSALQSIEGLLLPKVKNGEKLFIEPIVPITMKKLEIIENCSREMWAYISLPSENGEECLNNGYINSVDIILCNEQGNICAKLIGCSCCLSDSVQVVRQEEQIENIMIPEWQPVQFELNDDSYNISKKTLIICGDKQSREELEEKNSLGPIWDVSDKEFTLYEMESQLRNFGAMNHFVWIVPFHEIISYGDETIISNQEKGIFFLFRMIKAFLSLGYGEKELKFTIITRRSQAVLKQERIDPTNGGILGLAAVMAKEFPNWNVQHFDIDCNLDVLFTDMSRIPADKDGDTIAFRNNSWYKQHLVPYDMTNSLKKSQSTIYREGGTYVVIGGAGGIGTIWSEYMIRTYHAQIIWIGRREKDVEIEEKIKRLSTIGKAPYYIAGDATSLDSLQKAYEEIKSKFQVVNGVIHSAVGTLDKSLRNMEEELYRAVVKVKINASVWMVKVFEREPLDFIVYFSSIASFLKLEGQSGYATGCTFKDAYAQRISKEVPCVVKTINWGDWGQVGIGHNMPQSAKIRLAKLGLEPIEPDKAVISMEKLMLAPECQLVYEKRCNKEEEALLEGNNETSMATRDIYCEQQNENNVEIVESILKERTIAYLKKAVSKVFKISYQKLEVNVQLEKYGLDSILIVHLTNELSKEIHDISSTLFFEFHTIEELADYIVKNKRDALIDIFSVSQGKVKQQNNSIRFAKNKLSVRSEKHQEEIEEKETMPIAIIGMSGRFPKSNNLLELWQNLKSGNDCISLIPEERWPLEGFYTDDIRKAIEQKMSYSKWGGFIDDFAKFDPLFFKISPHEATNMDPQERLFLQESWRAFEDAGYTKQKIANKYQGNVGIFVGVTKTGYEWYGTELQKEEYDIRPTTSFASIASRVSYLLDLHGPSLPIDTMCSSSLTAVHEACEHIRRGECQMAIAGGVNIYTHPSNYIYLCKMMMLSKTGKCHSFGKGADGFVPGEGVGAILLKPLSKAIEDRDQIYGIIKGTAINHGGKTNGYTVPNLNAQRDVIRQALDRAGVNARALSYIEAHGTGTELGDPIEIAALTQAFRKDTVDKEFCAVGSAKANIGHLEGAAGIAGLMKVILQMKYKQLVPSIHSQELNTKIDFAASPFYVQHELSEWKRPFIEVYGEKKEFPRIAGISAFGASGVNAHVIVEEYCEDKVGIDAIQNSQNGGRE